MVPVVVLRDSCSSGRNRVVVAGPASMSRLPVAS